MTMMSRLLELAIHLRALNAKRSLDITREEADAARPMLSKIYRPCASNPKKRGARRCWP